MARPPLLINRGPLLTSDPIPETSRQRFSDEEIAKLWEHQAEPWVDTVLIFIYSGWRISEPPEGTPGLICPVSELSFLSKGQKAAGGYDRWHQDKSRKKSDRPHPLENPSASGGSAGRGRPPVDQQRCYIYFKISIGVEN